MATPAEPPTIETSPGRSDTLRLAGAWTLANAARLAVEVERPRSATAADASAITRLDSAGALLLRRLLKRAGIPRDALHLDAGNAALMALVDAAEDAPAAKSPRRRGPLIELLDRVGHASTEAVVQTRNLLGFLGLTLLTLARVLLQPWRLRLTPTVHHMEQTGLDAVPLVALLSFLVGAVVAYLGANVLRDFGAEIYVVELVAIAFLREFGVLLTAILLAGRTASAFTAQIGAMKSREEIDAIRTLGLDPIELLVLPRLIALLIMLPLLTFIGTLAGLLGGMAVSAAELGISTEAFMTRFEETFALKHMLVGLAKAPVFAAVIALIGCLEGFKVAGTAQSVGERTTSSVVQSIMLVILLDAIAAVFTMEMGW
jgi:phospholipid/cholesterol/gamma-HCH transport system permease protein